jgi:hypothetical protein
MQEKSGENNNCAYDNALPLSKTCLIISISQDMEMPGLKAKHHQKLKTVTSQF